jgi:hypothetical protein
MKKWYKEPLLHFLAIGALIFGLFALVSDEKDVINKNKIIVTTADIERLSNNWAKKWRRPPTETELQGLIESHIKCITVKPLHSVLIRMTRSSGEG